MIRVLMVEDDVVQVELARALNEQLKILFELEVVRHGLEALSYLRREGAFIDAARPDLILLDLNLPGMSGLELLAQLSSDPSCADIPVVMMSSAEPSGEVLRQLKRHAAAFVVKPLGSAQYLHIVKAIANLGLMIVKLSPSSPSAEKSG